MTALYARKRSGNTACLASIRSSRDWEIEVLSLRGTYLPRRVRGLTSHRKRVHARVLRAISREVIARLHVRQSNRGRSEEECYTSCFLSKKMFRWALYTINFLRLNKLIFILALILASTETFCAENFVRDTPRSHNFLAFEMNEFAWQTERISSTRVCIKRVVFYFLSNHKPAV